MSFRSATEPFDTSTPVGRMLVQMLGVFAQFERETIIDRVINGMERKDSGGSAYFDDSVAATSRARATSRSTSARVENRDPLHRNSHQRSWRTAV